MRTQPTLITTRLMLRPFTIADAEGVTTLAKDQKIAETTATIPHPYPEGLAEQWIAQHQPRWQLKQLCCYAITLQKEGTLIGAISLMNIANSQAEVGYWVGIDYWNQGYCTEACKAIIDFGFNDLALTQINAHHLSSNPASGRVLLKAGLSHQCSDTVFWVKTQSDRNIERYQIKK